MFTQRKPTVDEGGVTRPYKKVGGWTTTPVNRNRSHSETSTTTGKVLQSPPGLNTQDKTRRKTRIVTIDETSQGFGMYIFTSLR